jgi:predicted Rossmann fold flavoprotein
MIERSKYDFVVIGGGAAGFFGALSAAAHNKGLKICILEKSSKLLAKVKVSGGGRCNVTHACFNNSELIKYYPRGAKELKQPFSQFTTKDTINWFESRGVRLKTEADGRMFPITNDSQTIIDCLLREAKMSGVEIVTGKGVNSIEIGGEFTLRLSDNSSIDTKKLLIATGGSPKAEGYDWIKQLGHSIELPVPSLFTFNIPGSDIRELQGVSMPSAKVKVLNTKLEESGPLLITHWGLSGPAVLKTSAWGARVLSDHGYQFSIHVNWTGKHNDESIRKELQEQIEAHKKKQISTLPFFNIPKRLWTYFLEKSEIEEERRWLDISKKQLNKLIENLIRSEFKVSGKTTFKEEFVTCGGVKLNEVDFKTLESKKVPGLFFAGEVLDIDGITGGFNFQNAWTTGWIAGKNCMTSQVRQ